MQFKISNFHFTIILNRTIGLPILFFLVMDVALSLGLPPQAYAVWKDLTPQQTQEALEYGKNGKGLDMAVFAREWTVTLGERVGWATLYTPFHSLAYKARKAEVEHRELTDNEIKKAISTEETLSFSVTVLGDELYFTRMRAATLRQGEVSVSSSYEFLPDMCESSNFFPESPAYMATCVYRFSPKGLALDAPVNLVVVKPTGEELLFNFDLSKMR